MSHHSGVMLLAVLHVIFWQGVPSVVVLARPGICCVHTLG